MKRHVRSNLRRFTRADLQARMDQAKCCATREVWAAAVRRARDFEANYWVSDNLPDAVYPVIIDVGDVGDDEDQDDDEFFDDYDFVSEEEGDE